VLKKKYKLGKAIIEGIIFLLPITLLIVVYKWTYSFILKFARPLSFLFFARTEFIYIISTIIIVIIICYIIGISIKTKKGRFILSRINRIFANLPGYSFLLSIVIRIFKSHTGAFSKVALVNIFENDTLVTGFITDEHKNGMKTVFVPTGPNPTSGNIYHLKSKYVKIIDIPIEDAMRSIISCGNGSKKLIEQLKGKIKD